MNVCETCVNIAVEELREATPSATAIYWTPSEIRKEQGCKTGTCDYCERPTADIIAITIVV